MSIFDIYNENIKVTIMPENQVLNIKPGTPAIKFLPHNEDVIAVYSNNELLSLQEGIDIQANIVPVYKNDKMALGLLTDTLCFLVQASACELFPGMTLHHKYNIQRGLFFQFNDMQSTQEDIEAIEKRMNKLVNLQLPLLRANLSHADAAAEMLKIRHLIAYQMILTLNNPIESMIEMNVPNEKPFRLFWRNPVLAHTGVCKNLFKLTAYNQGFIVHYADDWKTVNTQPIRGSAALQSNLCTIMDMYIQQANTVNFGSLASINQLITEPKKLQEAIAYAEFNHEKMIGEVAARASKDTRVIFIAGPSSSGKTTFANRVSCHLRSRGFKPIRVSLDDFYGLPALAPRIPGTDKPDFEHLEALDLKRIKDCLTGLIAGEEVVMAHYDFVKQVPGNGAKLVLPSNGILVVEGIHALNDAITMVVPENQRMRVFIQPIGALPWDETRIVDYHLTRLMRRMCRDYLFRGRSADATIESWAGVRAGEEEWILPNQVKADVYFNSSIMYEQFVLRVYAVPLLQLVPQSSHNYAMARQLLRMLAPLQPIQVSMVPEMSLLCEFLPGGSQYEEFFF